MGGAVAVGLALAMFLWFVNGISDPVGPEAPRLRVIVGLRAQGDGLVMHMGSECPQDTRLMVEFSKSDIEFRRGSFALQQPSTVVELPNPGAWGETVRGLGNV
jgi:hypothetical protein